jgi:hypothetical protein
MRVVMGEIWLVNSKGVYEQGAEENIWAEERGNDGRAKKKLHNEELRDLYSSPTKIIIIKSRRMRWAGHVARMGEKRNSYRLLVGKPEGKKPLGRPRRRWVNNINMDLGEIGWGGIDWIGLSQERDKWKVLVNVGSIKCWETVEWLHNWWPLE